MSRHEPHPVARVVLSGLVQEGEVIRLSDDLRPKLEAAIIASIEDESLRVAVDELISLVAHLEQNGAQEGARSLMNILHGLVATLDLETRARGSKVVGSSEVRGATEALLGTPRERVDDKLGQKPTQPWWMVRTTSAPDDDDGRE